jgi:hypothetical protein
MIISVKRELEFSVRRKFEALAVMIKRLSSQMGKENDFPLRMNPAPYWQIWNERVGIRGTNMTTNRFKLARPKFELVEQKVEIE